MRRWRRKKRRVEDEEEKEKHTAPGSNSSCVHLEDVAQGHICQATWTLLYILSQIRYKKLKPTLSAGHTCMNVMQTATCITSINLHLSACEKVPPRCLRAHEHTNDQPFCSHSRHNLGCKKLVAHGTTKRRNYCSWCATIQWWDVANQSGRHRPNVVDVVNIVSSRTAAGSGIGLRL